MRTSKLAAFLLSLASVLLFLSAAHAEDTKPPAITDVKPAIKGGNVTIEATITDETGVMSATVHHRGKSGKVEDTTMVKNEYDDVFKATFPGSAETEYWIDASDILGNGPSNYGSSSKPMAANGKAARSSTAVATKEFTPTTEPAPKAEPPPRVETETRHHRESASGERAPHKAHHGSKAAAEPPTIEHRKPAAQPPEGQDFTVRVKIHSEVPVPVAVLQSKAAGTSSFTNAPLQHIDGDNYEAKITAAAAKGTVEYFIVAKNEAGLMTHQGDGDSKTPYTVTFKAGTAAAGAVADKGGWSFTHWSVNRVDPNQPLLIRAQIAPAGEDGQVPDKAMVLFRGNDGQDQQANMLPDPNGGFGGFKAELPAQADGAVYYQIVACDDAGTKCAVDTGSKKKWHGTAVGEKGSEVPLPLNASSSKAPASLPD